MITKLEEDLKALLFEVDAYNSKPNKSISGRIRKGLGNLKKEVTAIRAHLVEADSKGY